MTYHNSTKKFSHCQYLRLRPLCKPFGFFMLEFIYTLFIVTSFVWIISMYLTLSIYWQQQASNQLIALTLAQNSIEQIWVDGKAYTESGKQTHDQFTIEWRNEKHPMPRHIPWSNNQPIPLIIFHVTVSWLDDRKSMHTITIQTHR